MKEDIEVKAWDYGHDRGDIPTKPDEFIKYWQDKIDLVPEEYRDSTRIEIEADSYYDCGSLYASVSYTRPETDSEYGIRMRSEELSEKRHKASELRKLEELKAKYEGGE